MWAQVGSSFCRAATAAASGPLPSTPRRSWTLKLLPSFSSGSLGIEAAAVAAARHLVKMRPGSSHLPLASVRAFLLQLPRVRTRALLPTTTAATTNTASGPLWALTPGKEELQGSPGLGSGQRQQEGPVSSEGEMVMPTTRSCFILAPSSSFCLVATTAHHG